MVLDILEGYGKGAQSRVLLMGKQRLNAFLSVASIQLPTFSLKNNCSRQPSRKVNIMVNSLKINRI